MSGHSRQSPRSPRGASSRPDSGGADTATAILLATEELLADNLLSDLSVAQIIERAGISRATFYFHYASKFSVVAALVEQAIQEMYEVSRQTHRDNPAPSRAAGLEQRIRDSARVWDAHRPVLKATVENWYVYPELGEAWLALIAGLTADIADELDSRRGPVAAGPDAHTMAAMLAWMTERCLYNLGDTGLVAPEEREEYLSALTLVWITVMIPGTGAGTDRRAA